MNEAKYIDLRSDTVTRPTPSMRKAMAEAEVGDDVYGEDPTVNRLEQRAAEITGKESALFVPTGTMGNTIAIKVHTHHGQEVICDARAHLLDWELSMTAWFAGCLVRTVSSPSGVPRWEHIRTALRSFGQHNAPTACIEIENTHNMLGGRVYPLADIDEICQEAHALNLKVHMDGARVFNAATALSQPVARVVRDVDTVMFCLSKALGAPVGSMLCGPAESIAQARLYRKRLGGGMRQAGILAAAGLVALEETPPRLSQDHANARLFAEAIQRLPGIHLDPATVETNIVIFDVSATGSSPQAISGALKSRGILLNGINDRQLRAVTHYDVSAEDRAVAAEALRDVLAGGTQRASA
jgi:threonine aldolase